MRRRFRAWMKELRRELLEMEREALEKTDAGGRIGWTLFKSLLGWMCRFDLRRAK